MCEKCRTDGAVVNFARLPDEAMPGPVAAGVGLKTRLCYKERP